MSSILRWGVMGTGNIARQFAAGVASARGSRILAVGSRSRESASAFAGGHQIPQAYGSYDDLLADPNIDAVYISLPNSLHHQWTLRSLRAGKHVLCEKPFARNLAESQEMIDAAQKAGRILIEGFMYLAHPLTNAVMSQVRQGAIGPVKIIRSSFCYRTSRMAGNIRFDPLLAGGALMDIGCYCTSFSMLIAGSAPTSLHATGRLHPTGVDEFVAGTLTFPNNIVASFTCGMTVQADNTASICGEEGFVEIPIPWKPPRQRAAYIVGRSTPPRMDSVGNAIPSPPPRETHHVDADMDLYACEADAFAATVLDGKPPFMSSQMTLDNMRILDELRRQIGVAF
jgi:predicted dehydrogenase